MAPPSVPRSSASGSFKEPTPAFAGLLSKWKENDAESEVKVSFYRKSRVEAKAELLEANKKKSGEGKSNNSSKKALRQLKNVYQQPLPKRPSQFQPPVFEHTFVEKELLMKALRKNFVFSDLSQKELAPLVSAFETCQFKAGDTVIKQGDPGDFFYVIQSGTVAFHVNGIKVGQAGKGSSFGELALLYTCPRAATVLALEDAGLFRVDQMTFRYILQSQTQASEQEKLDLLKGVSFIKDLSASDMKKLAQVMTPRVFSENEEFFQKGDKGDSFYLIQEGSVLVKDISVGTTVYEDQTLGPGNYFGERALVTSERRAATVLGTSKGIVFTIDHETFDRVLGNMSKVVLRAEDERKLKGIKFLTPFKLDAGQIASLTRLITDTNFAKGQDIVRKGEAAEAAFYIVREGKVLLTSKDDPDRDRLIGEGGYFGESLMSKVQSPYTAVVEEDCVCGMLTLSDCSTVFDIGRSGGEDDAMEGPVPGEHEKPRVDVKLEELERHKILGEGTFGQVWLVSTTVDGKRCPFALKIQSKQELADEGQIDAVLREKELMMKMDHPFILNLVQTYSDKHLIYLLLDFHQGGELFSVLHPDDVIKGLPESQVKFYVAGVADALAYMHRGKIVFRDLKPENVMIDAHGYPIIIDFGFAKVVTDKTYTLCGTPGYLPHCSADHWSMGILICELASGSNPFFFPGMDQMTLFESIVQDDYDEPKDASKELQDIVSKLLVKDPTRRLGSLARGERDIFEHPWLSDMDLKALRRREIKAPWVPDTSDPLDTGCFDDWGHLEDKMTASYLPLKERDAVLFEGF